MIDTVKYKKEFEARCLEAGFTKLDEPVDGALPLYTAIEPNVDDFLVFYWEPIMRAMIKTIAEKENGEFYRVDVFYNSDKVLIITASRGAGTSKDTTFVWR